MFIEIILSNQNTKNIYKNFARSASRKDLQIAFQDAKKHNQKQTNYFEIQAQHQWKNFAHFIENNKIKIANKIKAKYKKKILYLSRHFKMLHHTYNQNKILNLYLEFFNSSRFFGKYFYLWNEELNFHHGNPRMVTLSEYCTCCIRPRSH